MRTFPFFARLDPERRASSSESGAHQRHAWGRPASLQRRSPVRAAGPGRRTSDMRAAGLLAHGSLRSAAFPLSRIGKQWRVGGSLAAYSCGHSRGLGCFVSRTAFPVRVPCGTTVAAPLFRPAETLSKPYPRLTFCERQLKTPTLRALRPRGPSAPMLLRLPERQGPTHGQGKV
jgi:hypothetical protein